MDHMECTALVVKFKTSMIRSSLCDYSDKYILAKWTITVTNTTAAAGAAPFKRNRKSNI